MNLGIGKVFDGFGKLYARDRAIEACTDLNGTIATLLIPMYDMTSQLTELALQEGTAAPAIGPTAAAALAVGLAGLGTGIAQSRIGASAVGAVAEDDDMFVPALIFTALPETLIIIAFVTIFVAT